MRKFFFTLFLSILLMNFKVSVFPIDVGEKYDILRKKAYIDEGDFLTKKDFITNKDLPKIKGIKTGPFTVHSILKEEILWDSNVFVAPDGQEEDDLIFITKPSVSVVLPIKDFTMGIGYDIESYKYDSFTSEDHTNKFISALAEYKFTDFTISIKDLKSKYSYRSGADDRNRIKRDDNEFRVDVYAFFDQLGYLVGYSYKKQDYLDSRELTAEGLTYEDKDKTIQKGNIQLSYRFLPKTSALFEWIYGEGDYDSYKSPDYNFNEILIGLKGDLRHNLSTYIKVGYKKQDYDYSEYTVHTDYSKPVARGGIEYVFNEDNVLNLSIEKNVYESTYRDMNFYDVNFVSLSWTHIFGHKTASKCYLSYQYNKYPEESTEDNETKRRKDKFYGFGASLRYYIRNWLSSEIKYEYMKRNANFDVFDYERNIITFKIAIGF